MKENILLQPNEEIRSIMGYEELYSITSFGRVWSYEKIRKFGKYAKRVFKGKFLKENKDKDNYLEVNLCRNNKIKKYKISHLVAESYISNPQNLSEVNHKDTDKQNNDKDNLEWCTHKYNMKHAFENGLMLQKISKYYGVGYRGKQKNKKWGAFIFTERRQIYIGFYNAEIEAAKAYNDYVVEHNLDRLLNVIDEKIYLKSIEDNIKYLKIKGVVCRKNKKKKPWGSQIRVKKETKFLGYFETKNEAAKAYNNYVIKYGLNRSLNRIGGL